MELLRRCVLLLCRVMAKRGVTRADVSRVNVWCLDDRWLLPNRVDTGTALTLRKICRVICYFELVEVKPC